MALFWVGTVAAGLAEPAYAPRRDYLSALAARDSTVAPWAITAFCASAVAHAAGAEALRRTAGGDRSRRAAAGALVAAAVAVVAIAGFRLSGSGPDDLLDTLHAAAVLAYQVAWIAAVVLRGPRAAGAVAAAASTSRRASAR